MNYVIQSCASDLFNINVSWWCSLSVIDCIHCFGWVGSNVVFQKQKKKKHLQKKCGLVGGKLFDALLQELKDPTATLLVMCHYVMFLFSIFVGEGIS